jgi:hypothetical protein
VTETLADFLNSVGADTDRLQQALRTYVSERTDDLTREEMSAELRSAATDQVEMNRILVTLESDSDALVAAALLYFEQEWEDESARPAIRAAFRHAKSRLPVVETAILAVVAMYAMYLHTTSGVLEQTRTTKQKADGSFETTVREKREGFHPTIAAISKMWRRDANVESTE